MNLGPLRMLLFHANPILINYNTVDSSTSLPTKLCPFLQVSITFSSTSSDIYGVLNFWLRVFSSQPAPHFFSRNAVVVLHKSNNVKNANSCTFVEGRSAKPLFYLVIERFVIYHVYKGIVKAQE